MKRLLKWLLPIIILGIAIAGFISLKSSKPKMPPKPITERSWSVNAIAASPQSIAPEIELYAEVENPRQVVLRASIAADVQSVEVREGATIKQGDLLIQLDTSDIDLQIAQQRAQIDALKAQLSAELLRFETDKKALAIEEEMLVIAQRSQQRQLNLSGKKLASQEQLDTAEMNTQQRQLSLVSRKQSLADHPNRVAQLKASIAQSQAQLDKSLLDRERAFVKAPFDGRATKISIAVGDRLRANDALASVYPNSDLEVRAQLPSRALALIKSQSSLADLEAVAKIDGQQFELELDRLSAEVATGSTGVDGLFRFVDSDYLPEPGRTISVALTLPELNDVIALPPVALYGTDRIYRVTDSRLEAVTVNHLGYRTNSNDQREILIKSDQLNAGDKIITTQLPNAVSGMLVEVKQ
ncbi:MULTISPECIES: biotin/lipoyl-binding protein [unclassified Marinobacterium]|uniref:efflux RND transporter periplasmic adaptor subunit n=1 Tax=unclassified Marinobacterium TaxID=2644139 RepID=UPI001567F33C|nr:Multidrug resistance protein MdtA precursor [Marinobacterium sp. xm-d-510]NRP97014.1 Multidrug resistance protein MdtA precursor [Marinobacterium sp. xm-a-127]